MTLSPVPGAGRMRSGFDRDRHSRIVARLAEPPSVGECLVYDDMTDVPPQFDAFAKKHFLDHYAASGIPWREACPVYALALMAHGSYRMPDDEGEIETLWQELAPSPHAWDEARAIVADVWCELDRNRGLTAGR